MVREPEDYKYSSARTHLLGKSDKLLKEPLFNKYEMNEYKRFMKTVEDRKELDEIRRQTRLGKPLGDRKFLETLSEKLGHTLVFRSKGRPKKGVNK